MAEFNIEEGLYDSIINENMKENLEKMSESFFIENKKIDMEESSEDLAHYFSAVLWNYLKEIKEKSPAKNKVKDQIELVNKLILGLGNYMEDTDAGAYLISDEALELQSIYSKTNRLQDFSAKEIVKRPETSLSKSSLFTGAFNEPQMQSELKAEIFSADRIDMLVSFIKWSGLRILLESLKEFTFNGGKLRVITTSYMGATDLKAIEELNKLPNTEIKVSYDTKTTRLHAKAYVFYRNTGFTTAYVGSSNLSNSALTSGLEWNVKMTRQDLAANIEKIEATFESYWNSNRFEFYSEEKRPKLQKALRREGASKDDGIELCLDIQPYTYQQEVLDQLEAERKVRNQYRNLIVAATGERVIIVMGAINVFKSRVSETLTKYNSCIA